MVAARWRLAAFAALAAFPWLNPVAPGPSPAAVPWLASMASGLALWSLADWPRIGAGPACALAASLAWAAAWHLPVRPELVFLASALALVAVAAAVGRAAHDDLATPIKWGWLAAATATAAIGLCQYFGFVDIFEPWMNVAKPGEAYGNLRQTNQYATLCWVGAALLLWGHLRLPAGVAPVLMVMLGVAGAASVSRTGLLQGLTLAALALAWRGPHRRERLVLCLVAAMAYFAAAMALPVLLDMLTGAMPARTLWGRLGSGEGCSSRLVLWSNVLHLIALKPLTGWGWGELDFAHFDTLYAGPRFCDILDNAHNLPLHFAVELGVPAAVLLCGLGVWWAWRQRPWAETVPQRQLAWAVIALILLHSMLEYPLWYGPFQIAFGASLGWLCADTSPRPATARGRLQAAGIALGLLAATGYAAWDYARVSQIYLPPEQRRAAWADDTLAQVRRSWLFSGQARFADLTLATPQQDNAEWMYALSQEALHYSPEPRVIERAIESATYLGKFDEAVLLLARYRAAFPKDYEAWRQAQKLPKPPRP